MFLSNLGWDNIYADFGFLWLCSVPSSKFRDITSTCEPPDPPKKMDSHFFKGGGSRKIAYRLTIKLFMTILTDSIKVVRMEERVSTLNL